MRLDFSVLWFDDNEEYIDSLDMDVLEEEIIKWGFSPNIQLVTTPEKFLSFSPFAEFDLIVVDYNLEGYKNGQEFIADIRSNAVFTEIIFYTAGNASNLWDAIRDKKLEGIFVSSRPNILSKIMKVGHQSIRKVLDLENMRGIVMAEVGELDHLLDEIITLGLSSLPPNQQKEIFQRFYEKSMAQHQGEIQKLNNFIKEPDIHTMLSLCDSNKRWQNFNRLWKSQPKLKKRPRIGQYDQDVLKPRNFLAHGTPIPHEDEGYIFHHYGQEFHFDEETSLSLRQTILHYKNEFSNLIELLY